MTAAALAAGTVATSSAQQQEPPRFRTSVELNTIDVNVVDDHGKPITGLGPGDFIVRVGGEVRRVVSAEWTASNGTASGPPVVVPADYSTNEASAGGRLIVLAIDQPNIHINRTLEITTAASAFIDGILPADRMAVIGFGNGAKATPFTSDRERLKRAVSLMVGQARTNNFAGSHTITSAEAQSIANGNVRTLEEVASRECAAYVRVPNLFGQCRGEIDMTAGMLAVDAQRGTDDAIHRLRELLKGLQAIPGPKTLIVVSEGFSAGDVGPHVTDLGLLAAAARVSIYGVQFDYENDLLESGRGVIRVVSREPNGLEMLAATSRGASFRVAGTARVAFRRIESELSGYYLLGVESGAGNPTARRIRSEWK